MSIRELPTAPASSRGAPLTDRDQESVAPFPLAADQPGRPYIRPHRMAQVANDVGMREALRQRLDGPPVHIEIGNDPFLSRVGKWAYAAIDSFCFWVIITVPVALMVAVIVSAARP